MSLNRLLVSSFSIQRILKKVDICYYKFLQCFFSCLQPALIPPIHIAVLYYFWYEYSRTIDRKHCSCSCWDTVFKGPYEKGVASYKHMYFNASRNTMKIWITTVICIIAFYESVKRVIRLGTQNQIRWRMLMLFISAIFAHYYSWWSYLNYWNDDFYEQWNHQLYFTLTELLSTWTVLNLVDKQQMYSRKKAFFIVGIALVHTIAGSVDQFIMNVLQGAGEPHQILRDVCFMIPDLMHMILPIVELFKSGNHYNRSGVMKDFISMLTMVIVGLIVFLCL